MENFVEAETDLRGLVFDIQKFSLHDGPGIRTTVFIKGCPLVCKWCSNPESQSLKQQIMTHDIRCIGCGKCAEACGTGAIAFTEAGREIDWEKCNECLECAKVCPARGIETVGKFMTVDEVVAKVEQDRIFYENSGGGMTVSGGEPLVQWEFVSRVLERCREKGIHTALDTCGMAPWRDLERVIEHTDLVLFDVKHMDSAIHKEGTGVGNETILENARKVAERTTTWVRIPLIPGFNDSESNLTRVAQFAGEIGAEKISLLPYHNYGSSKYPKLGRTYPMEGTPRLADEKVEALKRWLETMGYRVEIGR
ncbi:MAG TPA: glycyl-radical enzyme activating protein [Anaerolineae bacterium]|nr:glycyl-radical enzyme activating protein [Anaerolineae bacterium]